jgi:hypothetical protein
LPARHAARPPQCGTAQAGLASPETDLRPDPSLVLCRDPSCSCDRPVSVGHHAGSSSRRLRQPFAVHPLRLTSKEGVASTSRTPDWDPFVDIAHAGCADRRSGFRSFDARRAQRASLAGEVPGR